ncbi:MAG: hypothetical protein RLZZ234_417 [Candidatus Parcubacteria bacterium]
METHSHGGRGHSRRQASGGHSRAGTGPSRGRTSSPSRRPYRPHGGSSVGGIIQADDIGDTIITVGTDTSDMPDIAPGAVSSYTRPTYAQGGSSRTSRGGTSRGGQSSFRGGYSSQRGDSRTRAWSPESSTRGGSARGGSFRSGGNRSANDFNRGSRGGSRGGGRGRRFVAPDLDIERFIEKSKRESAAHKANASAIPDHVVTNNFASLISHPKLRAQVTAKGYSIPTPIQDKAIPHVREKKDIVGIANTGTGKTAAFLIPLIDRALVHEHEKTLIVVPTRELATQIYDEYIGFARGLGVSAAVVIGGANIRPQIASVRNARFVIGTPGRLKDLIERRALDMKSFTQSCSMKPTVCSTWALSPTFVSLWSACITSVTHSVSRQLCRLRLSVSLVNF